MANGWRKTLAVVVLVVGGTIGIALDAVVAQTLPAAPSAASANRVRSEDPALRQMIDEATRRSAVFRGLVAAIARTDGLVYVDRGTCRGGVRACLSLSMTVSGPYRLLRVRLDRQRRGDAGIASLGHELRHALEILVEPAITTGSGMLLYYKRFGTWRGDASFETTAAEAAEDAIRRELRRSAPR